jgi:carboxymethylenebutenolidase
MTGQMIDFKGNGQTFQGYFSQGAAKAPGILVIQEWWGLVDQIKEVADRFASAGYTAFAPDLYHGKKTTSPDEAGKMFMALNIAEAEKILAGAIDTLSSHPACSSKTVGVIGFCMGGQLSLYAACANPNKVSACVDFYGVHPNVNPQIDQLKAPVLGIFAELDGFVNADVVSTLSAKLKAAGKHHEFHTYPGVNHAFFNRTNAGFNQAAADDAWKRTLEFFSTHLRQGA